MGRQQGAGDARRDCSIMPLEIETTELKYMPERQMAALLAPFPLTCCNSPVTRFEMRTCRRRFAGQASETAKFQFFEEAMHFQEIGANLRLANERLECMLATNKGDEAGLKVGSGREARRRARGVRCE